MNENQFDKAFDRAYEGMLKAIKESEKKSSTTVRFKLFSWLMPFLILWGTGIVVAQGFWWTFSTIFVPLIGPGTAVYWMVEKFAGGQ